MMASVTVSTNPSTTGNTLTVNFTTDATDITDVQLTKDGSNYISATSFSNTSATFNVSSWGNGTYNNCYLKVIYTEASSGNDFSTESGSFGAVLQGASTWYLIGDSISDTGLIPQRKYMTVLGEAFSNVTITNLGKDGSHFTNKTTGYQRFITQLQNHSTTTPSLITIFGGVNDYIQNVSIGDSSSTDNTNFYGALKEFVSALNTKYPSSKKVFILPLNMRNGAFSTNPNGTNSLGNTLANYRDAMISVLNSNSMTYIDLHDDSELQPDLITSDGLHPNQDGHALLARKLCAAIMTEGTGGGDSGGGDSGGGDSGGGDSGGGDSGGGDSGGSTGTYTSAVSGDFTTVGNCSGISIDSSNNLVASSIGQWGMVKLNKTISKLRFNVRGNQADYGALCWYIYNDNSDGTYNMIALGNILGGENGKRFKMTIPGTAATQIDKLDIALINTGEQLTIEYGSGTQTIKRSDGSTLVTLEGNMSGWCGQSNNSSPFCSNVQYME